MRGAKLAEQSTTISDFRPRDRKEKKKGAWRMLEEALQLRY